MRRSREQCAGIGRILPQDRNGTGVDPIYKAEVVVCQLGAARETRFRFRLWRLAAVS